jgi:hypothetical protein
MLRSRLHREFIQDKAGSLPAGKLTIAARQGCNKTLIAPSCFFWKIS